jgi:hypothetical protein
LNSLTAALAPGTRTGLRNVPWIAPVSVDEISLTLPAWT